MKLYGSTTSPYVRRLRMFLFEQAFEFINLDIFSKEDRALLTQANPTQKIPYLVDNDISIYDSGVIFRYLTQKLALKPLTWQQENALTLINAVNDSMISMLVLQRSMIDVEQNALFFDLQRERTETVLTELSSMAKNNEFKEWDYIAISLFCLLDWLSFRSLYDWQKFKDLQSFHSLHLTRSCVVKTAP